MAVDDRREGEAVRNARQRIALLAETVGVRHPDYATGLNQLALLLIMQGEPDTAEPLLREALEIRRETLGDDHPDFATNLSSLGGLLWARSELDQAEPLLRRAAEIRLATLGPSHPKTIVSRNSLEQLLQARKASGMGREAEPEPMAPPVVVVPPAPTPDAQEPEAEHVPEPAVAATATEEAVEPERLPPLPWPSEVGEPLVIAPLAPPEPQPPIADVPRSAAPAVPTVYGGLAGADPTDSDWSREGVAAPEGPSPPAEPPDLSGRVGWLVEEFSALSKALEGAALAMGAGRVFPSQALLARARASRRAFVAAVADAARRAAEEGLGGVDEPRDLDGLRALRDRIEQAAEARRRVDAEREAVLSILDRLSRLTCPADPGSPALSACLESIAATRGRVATGPHEEWAADAEAIRDGRHPAKALLDLVEADDSVTDARWADWFDRIEAGFGSPVAVAAARARFAISAP